MGLLDVFSGSLSDRYRIALKAFDPQDKSDWAELATQLEQLSAKARKKKDPDLAGRAGFAGSLVRWFDDGQLSSLLEVIQSLAGLSVVDRPGDPDDRLPVDKVRAELDARRLEYEIVSSSRGPELARLHGQCAERYGECSEGVPVTLRHNPPRQGALPQAAQRRLHHLGMAALVGAGLEADADPDRAAVGLAQAYSHFQQAGEADLAERANEKMAEMRRARSCWYCAREFQGDGVHYSTIGVRFSPYMRKRVKDLGLDVTSVDLDHNSIVACTVCRSSIHTMATGIAQEHARQAVASLERRVAELEAERLLRQEQ